jgi:predicted MFS family arabinose efflux permease
MSSDDTSPNRLFIPSLLLAGFATQPAETILSLLLIDIAESFNTTIATMGQIRTAAAVLSFISAISMGILSIKIQHKKLLLTGLGFLIISSIGCSLSQNYPMMIVTYSLSGISLAMVNPMAFALIGKHIPLEKRAQATGYLVAGTASSFLIGGPILSYLTNLGSWRTTFLFYMLPFALISALLSWFGVPSENKIQSTVEAGSYIEGLKSLLSNKSVIACLLGSLLAKATWQGVLSYGISFYRERFMLSRNMASLLLSGLALVFITAVLGSSWFINRYGRKSVTFFSFLLMAVFSFFYMIFELFWVSVAVLMVMGVVSGLRRNASQSLSLEQVPLLRGSMMSLSAAGDSLGSVVGAGVGGYALGIGGYWSMSMVLGILGIISALTIRFYAVDPTKIKN